MCPGVIRQSRRHEDRHASRPAVPISYLVEPVENLTFGRVIAQAERLASALGREATPMCVWNPDLDRPQPGGSQRLSALADTLCSGDSISHGAIPARYMKYRRPNGALHAKVASHSNLKRASEPATAGSSFNPGNPASARSPRARCGAMPHGWAAGWWSAP